jgi:hypothetical protein
MRVGVLWVAFVLASCAFDASRSTENDAGRLRCADKSDCPAGLICIGELQRYCARADSVSDVQVVSLSVRRADGRVGQRFSRAPGFDRGEVAVVVSGAAESVEVSIAGQQLDCVATETGYRCPFAVTAQTIEGSELARVTARDALGRPSSERAQVVFDFTAPQVTTGSASLRIAAPETSILGRLGPEWAPSQAMRGSTITVSFALNESSAQNPTLRVANQPWAEATRTTSAWQASGALPSTTPEGPLDISVSTQDDVGNTSSQTLGVNLVFDATPPPAVRVDDGAVVVHRRRLQDHETTVEASPGAVEPGSLLLVQLPRATVSVGVARATNTGAVSPFRLSVPDAPLVLVSAVDPAGNVSPSVAARRYRLSVSPSQGLGAIERRPAFVPQLLVSRPETVVTNSLQSVDGLGLQVQAAPLLRRESKTSGAFGCAAAVADTARGTLVLGAPYRGCSVDEASLQVMRGAGLHRLATTFPAGARSHLVYDSLHSEMLVLPASTSAGGVLIVDTDIARRESSPPVGPVGAAAFDPTRAVTLVLGTDGGLAQLSRESGWSVVDPNFVRRGAGLAFDYERNQLVLAGGAANGQTVFGWGDGGFMPVGSAPAIADALLIWDSLAHALRLIERGGRRTWLAHGDAGFVEQPLLSGATDWVAPRPFFGDMLVNPNRQGSSYALRPDGGTRTWAHASPAEARESMAAIARPRGDLMVGGGAAGDYAYPEHFSYTPHFGWGSVSYWPALGQGTYIGQPDGAVLAVGGVPTNVDVWQSRSGSFSRLDMALLPRPVIPAVGWRLADDTYVIAGSNNANQVGFIRFAAGQLLDAGVQYPVVSGCAVSGPDGPLLIGGQRHCPPGSGIRCVVAESLWHDGGAWGPRPDFDLPAPRVGHGCVYDARRQAYLVLAGEYRDGLAFNLERKAGARWVALNDYMPDGLFTPRINSATAYDPLTATTVMFGGRVATEVYRSLDETWTYETSTTRPAVVFRFSLESFDVPLGANLRLVSAEATAGAEGPAGSGAQLLWWYDGAWAEIASGTGSVAQPSTIRWQLTAPHRGWFERHSLNVSVRGRAERGSGEASLFVDSLVVQLEYER